MSDVQTVPETETTAKPALPELPREEPAATARAETSAATPPIAESSAPAANTAATPETAAAPEKVEHGIGVLLVNLGTPDAPDAKAVRRYLKQFLTDPRVIEKRGQVVQDAGFRQALFHVARQAPHAPHRHE